MNKTIGALIKAYRNDLGLTQIDMAKIMRTSQSNVSKFESGILTPSLSHFARWYRYSDTRPVAWNWNLRQWLREGKL